MNANAADPAANPFLHLNGHFDGDTHTYAVRVYFEDTDFTGIVYHASYVRWFERGRTELLRAHGVELGRLATGPKHGTTFVVRRMEIDYLRPTRMDDIIEVTTRVAERMTAAVWMEQRIRLGDAAVASARVQAVHIDLATGRPVRLTGPWA